MTRESLSKRLFGHWDIDTLVAIAVGAAVYGVLFVYGELALSDTLTLNTSLLVLLMVGALCGGLPAALTAALGGLLGEWIAGRGFAPESYHLLYAAYGYILGAFALYGAYPAKGVFAWKHALCYGVLCIAGDVFVFGVLRPLLDAAFYAVPVRIDLEGALMSCATEAALPIVIGLPLLLVYAARKRKPKK